MRHRSLSSLEGEVLEKIAQSDLDAALWLIINFVEVIIRDHSSIAKVFGSRRLDELCQLIGAESVKTVESAKGSETSPIVYIATELYKTGGHTALIEDLIATVPDSKHIILLTNLFDGVDVDSIRKRFSLPRVTIESAAGASASQRLRWLQARLVALGPSKVYLFNHNHDAVAVAAVQPTLVGDFIFYHHGDHHLCLGVHLPFGRHVDPHNIGFFNCRDQLGIKENRYWPLVVRDRASCRTSDSFQSRRPLVTCSSGRGEKFQIIYLYSYIDEVPNILAATRGVHIHIGDLSAESVARIHAGLDKLNIDHARFVLIPWVENLWTAILEHRVDLYIASFPLGGARASIEAMGSGTPIAVHNNYLSRFHGGADLVYPEAFRWRRPAELQAYLKTLTHEELARQCGFARRYYERHHVFEKLQYVSCGQRSQLDPPPLGHYCPDALQAYLDGDIAVDQRAQDQCGALLVEVANNREAMVVQMNNVARLTAQLAVEQSDNIRPLLARLMRRIFGKRR